MAAAILVAPDSFKGTLGAAQVADALARGIESAGAVADRCPVADGGEGTLDALGARRVPAPAHDPLGREIEACFGVLDDGTAVVEVAAASGLTLIAPGERDAEAASSRGTGELIAAALAAGARRVLVCAGGSATTDGGAGALEAIGDTAGAELIVLCDVDAPWEQAARLFAPQKGADAAAVARLEARLDEHAARLARDPRGIPGGGAAGGLAGGLHAALGAQLVPGAAFVLDALRFDERAARAAAVITGEGRLDATTLRGKAPAAVARRAAPRPVHAVCGECTLGEREWREAGFASVRVARDEAQLLASGAAIAESLLA